MTGMTTNNSGSSSSISNNVPIGATSSNSMGSPFDNILNGGDWNGVVIGASSNVMTPMSSSTQDPLSNLMDSVNSLDPLNSMGKSLNEQVRALNRFSILIIISLNQSIVLCR